MSQCYRTCEIIALRNQKDYALPLHVDCSVEYELPTAAKPPAGSDTEPLLMIHPCYYRRAESQRRSPFVNNLPSGVTGSSGIGRRSSQTARVYPPRPLYPAEIVSIRPEAPPPVVKPVRLAGKRDPLLCGGDFSLSSDSGVSAGHWTDSDRSPVVPEFRTGPDSGIATPVSFLEEVIVPSDRGISARRRTASYAQTPCSCGKSRCAPPSLDAFESVVLAAFSTDSENRHPTGRCRERNSHQTCGLTRYGRVQLRQWLQSVRAGPSPRRKRTAPGPPRMLCYGTASPIVIR